MKRSNNQGFTLIELSMSLVFIAFIILFLVSTMLSIMRTYNKGIWLDQINQAGRQINADISDQTRYSKNKIVVKDADQRFCVGGVTYIWNTFDSFKNRYDEETNTDLTSKKTKLRFVRVLDDTGKYCYDNSSMPSRSDSNTSILLGPGVVVQHFKITEGKSGLLRVEVVFSTEGMISDNDRSDQPRLNPETGRWQCGQVIEGEFKATNNQYCAFAEFDIIVYRRMGE